MALEPGDTLAPEAALQLDEQAGLADPRFAHDAHDLAAALGRDGEPVPQELAARGRARPAS